MRVAESVDCAKYMVFGKHFELMVASGPRHRSCSNYISGSLTQIDQGVRVSGLLNSGEDDPGDI